MTIYGEQLDVLEPRTRDRDQLEVARGREIGVGALKLCLDHREALCGMVGVNVTGETIEGPQGGGDGVRLGGGRYWWDSVMPFSDGEV